MYSALGDNMGGMGSFGVGSTGMGAVMKEFRQQPYPVDVISLQLYDRLSGMQRQWGAPAQSELSKVIASCKLSLHRLCSADERVEC